MKKYICPLCKDEIVLEDDEEVIECYHNGVQSFLNNENIWDFLEIDKVNNGFQL